LINQAFILKAEMDALVCSMLKNDGFAPDLGCSSYLRIFFRVVLAMNEIQCHHRLSTWRVVTGSRLPEENRLCWNGDLL